MQRCHPDCWLPPDQTVPGFERFCDTRVWAGSCDLTRGSDSVQGETIGQRKALSWNGTPSGLYASGMCFHTRFSSLPQAPLFLGWGIQKKNRFRDDLGGLKGSRTVFYPSLAHFSPFFQVILAPVYDLFCGSFWAVPWHPPPQKTPPQRPRLWAGQGCQIG